MTEALLARSRQSRPNSSEKTRVIFNLADSASADQARLKLQRGGAEISKQLDAVNVVVANVPVAMLESLAAGDEVSWVSADQEVRSLAADEGSGKQCNQFDNTSHIEITTGASKVLPRDSDEQVGTGVANGGAGNGVGIAILDSGITPCDQAEFVGYQWKQSSGTLGTGLFSQKYLSTYNRIKKRINFTGESQSDDAYGHGTHTAGIAAGTGQSSENEARNTLERSNLWRHRDGR